MKNCLYFAFAIFALFSAVSCKKKSDNQPAASPAPTQTTAPSSFLNFSLDGAAKNYTANTSAGFKSVKGSSNITSQFQTDDETLMFRLWIPKDSIVGADLDSLIGKKISNGSCMFCPTTIELIHTIDKTYYRSSETENSTPTEYVKFTSVTFQKTVEVSNKKLNKYFVTGEFNLRITYVNTTKRLSNGTFGMYFYESKM